MDIIAIATEVLSFMYRQDVLVFSIAALLFALLVYSLDQIGVRLFGRSSILGVEFGGKYSKLQAIILWAGGAFIAGYLGGLVKLFNTESINSMLIVGVGWPTVLPRLVAMASSAEKGEEDEEVQSTQEEEEEQ